MMNTRVQLVFRQALSIVCALLVLQFGAPLIAQELPPPSEQPGSYAQALSPDQLANLVAPIALYPDSLLSQVLVAATYPIEVVEAGQWLQQNRNLRGAELVEAARQQNWDASIQALVVFPDVIGRLSSNIRWTTDLGNAFLAQQADVMDAVQHMRAQASAEGKLNSNPQETVTTQMQGERRVIEIQPANPQVIYVPAYDPQYVWGPPAYGDYPSLDDPQGSSGSGFGPGIFIDAFFAGIEAFFGGLGWGGWGWGLNWLGHSIFVNNNFFHHYGFSGFGGGDSYQGRGGWAHDPGHRMGVPYSNSALANRYYGTSGGRGGAGGTRSGVQGYASSRHASSGRMNSGGNFGNWGNRGTNGAPQRSFSQPGGTQYQQAYGSRGNFSRGAANNGAPQRSFSPQTNSAQGWQRFNGPGSGTDQAAANFGRSGWSTTSSSRPSSPAYSTNGGYRAGSSYGGNTGSYGAGRAASSYRPSSPAYSTNGGYRAGSSYAGNTGSYGAGRAASSYRPSSPAYSTNGGYRAGSSYAGSTGGYGAGRAASSYRPSSPAYGTGGGYRPSPSYSRSAGNGGGRASSGYRASSPARSNGGGSHGGGGHVSSHSNGGGGGSRSGGGHSSHSKGSSGHHRK